MRKYLFVSRDNRAYSLKDRTPRRARTVAPFPALLPVVALGAAAVLLCGVGRGQTCAPFHPGMRRVEPWRWWSPAHEAHGESGRCSGAACTGRGRAVVMPREAPR
jgi:hypothetical protein